MLVWHIEAITQENDELRRQNGILLDRLHQCKRDHRRNRDRLRNTLRLYKQIEEPLSDGQRFLRLIFKVYKDIQKYLRKAK